MAKDPAVLWYFGDWHGGTMTLTRHQKGCYMDLLCAQFNSGPLSLEEIKTVLGNDFAAWGVLSKKFKYDEKSGLFSNERLIAEKDKRVKHSLKQKENALKRWNKEDGICHGIAVAMPLENENENENEDKNGMGDARGKGFKKPSHFEVADYCEERGNSVDPQAFIDHYESNGWRVGKNPMKDWRAAVRTWERNSGNFSQDKGIERLKKLVI